MMYLSATPSPHNLGTNKTSKVMASVMLATVPGIATLIYFFGYGVLFQISICCISAVLSEAMILKIRQKDILFNLKDNSALLTGILLGISIPPLAPWWIGVIGTCFAIIVAKQLYGGLGFNLFNPAMIGYVLLLISFPVAMTNWLMPLELSHVVLSFSDYISAIFTGVTTTGLSVHDLRLGIDGITMATPLDTLKTDLTLGLTSGESMNKPVFNSLGGIGWFWVNIAFAIGGLVLLKLKVIRWHIPLAVLGSLLFFSLVGYLLNPDSQGSSLFHLFSGATMFGAFFIATDPVTAATSNKGRLLFGCFIGLLIYVIRTFGGFPDAMAFAILLANMTVPVIDYYSRPTTYGRGENNE